MAQDQQELAPAGTDQPADTQAAEARAAMYLGDLRIDKAFREIAEGYDSETREPTYQTGSPEAADPAEIALFGVDTADQSTEDSDGNARLRRFGRVGQAAESLYRAPETPTTTRAAERDVQIEGWTSKPMALREQLSQDTLFLEPDHYSVHNIAPQPDGGRGMAAMATAYVNHERDRARARTATDDDAEKSLVWAYSYSGLELRDFLASVGEQAGDDTVIKKTKAVLACDSQERLDAIEKSGLLQDWEVDFKLIDPQDPYNLAIPTGTAVALLPDSLDKLPAHQVLKSKQNGKALEIMENTQLAEDRPLISVTPYSGQTTVVTADMLDKHETASGADRYDLIAQLSGKLREPVPTPFELQHTDLDTEEHGVAAFLNSRPERLRDGGYAFNYAPDVEAVVREVTASVRADGLIYISGLLRNTTGLSSRKLASTQGPVVSHVLEETSLRHGVASGLADITTRQGREEPVAQAAILAVRQRGGGPGYLVIDRGGNNGELTPVLRSFETIVKGPEPGTPLDEAVTKFETAWDTLEANRADKAGRAERALAVAQAYDALKELYPQAGRDVGAVLAITRELNATGQHEQALELANTAAAAAPNLSAPLVEIARARLGLRLPPKQAFDTLVEAQELSPRNPDIYATVMAVYDAHPELKDSQLAKYAEAASSYLRYASGLTNDEIIGKLEVISQALLRDWELSQNDESTYKTVIVQDINTGTTTTHALKTKHMKRIIASDAALANAEAAGALRRYEGSDNDPVLRAQERLFSIWQRTVPRDAQGLPLPRDVWEDKPPLRNERWIYNGSIYRSDKKVAPPRLEQITAQAHSPATYTPEQSADAGEDDEYPVEAATSMYIGKEIDDNDDEQEAFDVFKRDLPGHVLITGRTGVGKTTLLERMLEGVPPMNANFWAFDLGDKSELYTIAERLKAKGTPVVIITPGDKDSIPVSIDLFKPVEGCSIEEHIGKFVDTWITAYGGGGDSPVGQILSGALRDIYAANGWAVKPLEDEEAPEVAEGEPRTPTLPELLEACVRRSEEYGKGTDAGNIPVYFKKRIEALQAGAFGDFLVGENALDWEQLNNMNVVFDFSRITSHDQRRFLFTALTMQASNYLQFQKGLRDEVKTVWAIDEASLITQNAGEGEMSRKQGVEAFTARLKVLRGYGVSIWNATQTALGIHPDFLSQNAVTIALSLKPTEEKKALLGSLGVDEGTPLYKRLFAKMSAAKPGIAIAWRNGMAEPVVIAVDKADKPGWRSLARAKQTRIRPPIKPNPYDSFTAGQHEEAMRAARRARQAWKQLFVGAVTIAHVAHIELPKVPEELQKQWQRETTVNRRGRLTEEQEAALRIKEEEKREMARLVLYNIVKQAVRERVSAVRTAYAPQELTASVMAHAMAALNGEPMAEYASPAFGLLPVRELRTFRELTDPRYGLPPRPQQLAQPLPYALPTPVAVRQRQPLKRRVRKHTVAPVGAQVISLERHRLSPVNRASADTAAKNAEMAFVGAVGNKSGAVLWRAMREVTNGEPDNGIQRREVAAALGYVASSYTPHDTSLASVLTLSKYLYDHGAITKEERAKAKKAA